MTSISKRRTVLVAVCSSKGRSRESGCEVIETVVRREDAGRDQSSRSGWGGVQAAGATLGR